MSCNPAIVYIDSSGATLSVKRTLLSSMQDCPGSLLGALTFVGCICEMVTPKWSGAMHINAGHRVGCTSMLERPSYKAC